MKELRIITVEEWKDIPQMEGYQASSLGRIRSCDRYVHNRRGLVKGRILKPYINKRGYPEVRVHLYVKKNLCQVVHKLVMRAFSEKPGANYQVNHINGIKSDNRLENLEWCTNSENQLHAWRLGLKRDLRGASNPNVKLTQEQIDHIRSITNWKYGDKKKLCDLYSISETHMQYILKGKTWTKNQES